MRDVAVDAFGNALGNSIVSNIKARADAKAKRQRENEQFNAGINRDMAAMNRGLENASKVTPEDVADYLSKNLNKRADSQRATNLSQELAFTEKTLEDNWQVSNASVMDISGYFNGSTEEKYLTQAHRYIADLHENGSLSTPGAYGRALTGSEIDGLYGRLSAGTNGVSWWNSESGNAFMSYYEQRMDQGPVALSGSETHLVVFSEAASAVERKMLVTNYVGGDVPVDELASYFMAIDDGAGVVDVSAGWYMSASKSLAGLDDTFYRRAYMDTNNLLSKNMFARTMELAGKHVGNTLLSVFEPAFKGGYFAGNTNAPLSFRQDAAWTLTAETAASIVGVGEVLWAARAAKAAGIRNVYHATTNPGAAQGVLGGINPKYLNSESRFGKAFYVAENPATTFAELRHHGVTASHGIRFELNTEKAKVLDLTNPATAEKWKYNGGDISEATQQIGYDALEQGYNVIRFYSERHPGGINNAVLDNFNELLIPQFVSPTSP